MAAGLTVDALPRRRWRATGLPTSTRGAAAATAAAEVHRLGAVQAQDFEATLWSLGRRTGQTRTALIEQFSRGEWVRTHTLRQTWHFVHRDDLLLVQAATAERVHRLNAALYRQEGLDPGTLQRAGEAILEEVSAGPRTRTQIGERLAAAGVPASGLRLGILMMWAELECLVVSGPMAGRQHTYVAWPDRRLPDRAEAVRWLAQGFFSSHGPATVEDFVAWSSLTRTQARAALADLPLRSAEVDGVEVRWLRLPGDSPWASPQVELLSGYDEYVSGSSAAGKRWLDRAGLSRGRLGTPLGMVMVDGQLAGRWRRAPARSRGRAPARSRGRARAPSPGRAPAPSGVTVDVLPLRRFTSSEAAALRRNVDLYESFLGVPATVELRADR